MDYENEYRREGDDDGEQDVDETDYRDQKDAIIFAIDVSHSMIQQPPARSDKKGDTDSPLTAALKSACQVMQQRIISQPKDMMCVLLFGTEKTKFQDERTGRGGSYPNCYLLTDLNVPAARDVKLLKRIVEDDDPDGILVPSSEPVSIVTVLHCAIQLFTTAAPNFGSRRLFLITDNDNPHNGKKEEKSAAAVRAKDLFDTDARIELFPISRDGKEFDLTKFYDDITYRPEFETGSIQRIQTAKSGDGLSLLKSLISNINSKRSPKRSQLSQVPFEVAPGLTISIKGYLLLTKQKPARTCYLYLEGEKPVLAKAETELVHKQTTRSVEKVEIQKGFKFGNEYVVFNQDELKALKESEPILRIIGFKSRDSLPSWASMQKSVFIYPSEEHYVGSTRVFSALWKKLLKDQKVAIAWFKPRVNTSPVIVAILPSEQRVDLESGTAFPPSGLWLYPLPFADDIRRLEWNETPRCPEEVIEKMRVIVQNLQLPKGRYNPDKYPNPSLQRHYEILQTLALEEDVPEPPEDLTIPKHKQIAKRVGGYIAEWKTLVNEAATNLADVRTMKREAGDSDDRPAKRPKTSAATSKFPPSLLSNAQLKTALREDRIKKMTAAQLKDILSAKGLATTGLKAALVGRLEQWVEENA